MRPRQVEKVPSRHLFSQHIPPFTRVIVVESGSRHLLEDLLPGIYEHHSDTLQSLDLVTCYAGLPKSFDSEKGEVFRVADYAGSQGRARLYRRLMDRQPVILGIICAAEPIMTKWKWALTLNVPAKTFILNENGDYFWLDYSNWKTIRHFALFRAGLAGAGAVRLLVRIAAFPFTLAYLLLYAAAVHLRRFARLKT
ncbi:MAG: hypothetical protein R2762_10440 [Bryobacteraceae bacterium]